MHVHDSPLFYPQYHQLLLFAFYSPNKSSLVSSLASCIRILWNIMSTTQIPRQIMISTVSFAFGHIMSSLTPCLYIFFYRHVETKMLTLSLSFLHQMPTSALSPCSVGYHSPFPSTVS
eukprot:966826_1